MAPGRLASPSIDAPTGLPTGKPSPSTNLKPAPSDNYGSYYPADPNTLSLESNFGPMEPGSVGFLQPTSAETPLEIMHERFERDGYLFVCRN
jgi:phytanoyl-CoA hydroxylase